MNCTVLAKHIRAICAAALILSLSSCDKTQYRASIGFRVKSISEGTKSAPVTTASIKSAYGQFKCDVWVADAEMPKTKVDQHYISEALVKYDAAAPGGYEWNFVDNDNAVLDYYWPNNIYMCFWSWAPVDDVLTTAGATRAIGDKTKDPSGALTFTYTLPAAGADGSDALRQNDLLFAFNHQKLEDGSYDGTVNIHFYHALSWVRFLIKEDVNSFDPNLDITDISICGVPKSGSCQFTPTASLVKDKFVWTPSATTASYKQSMTKEEFTTPLAANATEGNVSPEAKAFMLIPMDKVAGAEVQITFLRKDGSTVVKAASIADQTWLPGYFYTYRISATSLDDPIGFSVTLVDWIDGGTGNI